MSAPFLATVTVLSAAQPKSGGGSTVLAMITPLGGGHVDAGLPEGPGAVDPGWGVGTPARPGHDLPWAPGRPGHDLPFDPARPDAGLPGTPVPPEVTNPIPPPSGDLASQVVVLVYRPGQGWVGTSFTPPTPKA
jgi:hypothetical protein